MYYTKLDSFTHDFINGLNSMSIRKNWVAEGVKFAFKTKMITVTDS